MQTDILFRFPSVEAATRVGRLMRTVREDDTPILASFAFAQLVIGEHMIPTGVMIPGPFGDIPEMDGDGKHWILLRTLQDIPIPTSVAAYAVWHSSLESGGVPVPRPSSVDYPQHAWI
jgi:hypothetical protein